MSNLPAWLPAALDYVPQWLGYQIATTETPGCVLAIGYLGQEIFSHAWGYANLDTAEVLTPQHRFRVASHSKTFTAVSMLRLREQGLVKLDDEIGHYVRDLHPEISRVTIAQHSVECFRNIT